MTQIKNNINTYADLTAYNADLNKEYPNVSYIQGTDEVKYSDPRTTAVYNITSPTNVFVKGNTNNITKIELNGQEIEPINYKYDFGTSGTYTLKYTFVNQNQIPNDTFDGCAQLTSITIPSGVTSIGQSAFQSCIGLTNITIPNTVTSIGKSVFGGCTSLTSVTIPSGVTLFLETLFANCTSLTSVNIPSGVTLIGASVFNNCTSLTSVTIPSGVTSMGNYVFAKCTSLTSVTCLATTPPTLGTDIFYNASNCPIYVPAESVETYKAASGWNMYSSRIQAIPSV